MTSHLTFEMICQKNKGFLASICSNPFAKSNNLVFEESWCYQIRHLTQRQRMSSKIVKYLWSLDMVKQAKQMVACGVVRSTLLLSRIKLSRISPPAQCKKAGLSKLFKILINCKRSVSMFRKSLKNKVSTLFIKFGGVER